MPKRLRPRITFANVVSCLALFVALGSGAFAASKLPNNSVGTKQLKKNSVRTAKIKNNAVTLKKIKKNSINSAKVKKNSLTGADINLNKLGTVPSATSAASADALSPPEGVHLVGAAGEPGFEGGATNIGAFGEGATVQPVGFYKDHEGVVHLVGTAKAGAAVEGLVFRLPAGFRPASGVVEVFEAKNPVLVVGGNISPTGDGLVVALGANAGEPIFLSGITFRAGS